MDILEQMEIFSQEIFTGSGTDLETFFLFWLPLIIWSLIWKGIALWKAARLAQKRWFIAILIISSAGILEIIYIFLVANKYTVESKEVKNNVLENKM
jgi:hypothetical protein